MVLAALARSIVVRRAEVPGVRRSDDVVELADRSNARQLAQIEALAGEEHWPCGACALSEVAQKLSW